MLHLAAQALVHDGFDDPINTFETNVIGTVNVLEGVRRAPSVEAVATALGVAAEPPELTDDVGLPEPVPRG